MEFLVESLEGHLKEFLKGHLEFFFWKEICIFRGSLKEPLDEFPKESKNDFLANPQHSKKKSE